MAGARAPGRLGILGGTFDPPHIGHLAAAEEAREALGLARVLFVPAGDPWQKADHDVTPASIRAAMVELAIAGNPTFAVDRREVERQGPTYTAETLGELVADAAATEATEAVAPAEPWFILSAEALAGFHTWREPERILALARLCIVPRDGEPGPAVAAFLARYPAAAARLAVLDRPRLAVSSTEIRARVRAGRSIRYLVPDAVVALVREYALYRADPAPVPGPVG